MKRLRYLDEAKGLGILCITFLHYENGVIPASVNVFIGSFMITIFYVVAGWIMAMKKSGISTRELAHRRLRQLGLPYLYWTLIILAFDCILWVFGYYDTYFIARETYKSIVLRGIGTLWFLPALFFGEICWNWLKRKNCGVWIIVLALILTYHYYYNLIFDGHTSNIWLIIKAPFYSLNTATAGLLGVAVGYLTYKIIYRLINPNLRLISGIVGIALCVIAWFAANVWRLAWRYCAPFIGPLGWILLFNSIGQFSIFNFFDYWGRNSLALMVTHYSIVQVLLTILIVNGLHYTFCGWITIAAFIISMPIQYLIAIFINRYVPQIIGK